MFGFTIGFFINLYKLLRAVYHGIKYDQEFRVLVVVMLTFLISGTIFYWSVEGWRLIDAIYFSVMTMSTIGYGDLAPSTDVSKLFTIIYALLSIGVFVAVVTKIVTIIMAEKKASKTQVSHKNEAKQPAETGDETSREKVVPSQENDSKE